ncbi:Collagen alpha-4(VI) chain [Galemys pyrenaicus]|uniref:Collagen alpha-4(VI) chain n=1 Tax=Galemys pyrenaicus TaxID=202257 RepID=A0A8J6A705_GALPY|nr:Collagen alpha-4(VI) chain [Galemys pyrenaicus]
MFIGGINQQLTRAVTLGVPATGQCCPALLVTGVYHHRCCLDEAASLLWMRSGTTCESDLKEAKYFLCDARLGSCSGSSDLVLIHYHDLLFPFPGDRREVSVGDVVFLVHSNIRPQQVSNIRHFLSYLVGGFNVSREAMRVGLALYGDLPHSEFLLSTYHHKSGIRKHIQKLQLKPGGSKMGLALQFLLSDHFQEKAGSRASQGVPQIAVVISSQASEDPVQQPAQALRRAGVLLYAVGVKDAASWKLGEIASSPAEKFTASVPTFPALNSLAPKLLQELCATLAQADQPAYHISPAQRALGPQNFQKVKNFLHSVVLGLDISSDQAQVGLVQYSDNIYPTFQLNQYSQRNSVLEQIQNLPYRTGGTNTESSLEFIRTTYLTEAAGSGAKGRVPQIVILVTDGESNDEVQEAADRLKEDGVFVVSQEGFFRLCSTVEGKIKDNKGALPNSSTHASVHHEQSTQSEFTKTYADVVFLADTSQGTSQASFQKMQDFISGAINLLDVGRDKYQIGLAQYGGQGHTEFLLNTYQTKGEMIAHIKEHFALRGGPRRTGKALRYLHQTFFQEAAGSRFLQGTPQYAVVLTSGKSADEVQDTAQILRRKGVKLMSVGVQDFSRRELEEMGSLVYDMRNQDAFRRMMQDVSEMTPGSGKPRTSTVAEWEATVACQIAIPTDLVFLIEEFNGARQSNFQQVVNFLRTTVSSLRIHPEVVRMGLVFYNEEPRLEFSLDTFQNAKEILKHLEKLTYRGRRGKTKTSAALDFLRKSVFIQKGNRRGVQQMAVIITDSNSQDQVSGPASLLRKAGVTIYVVSTQLASDRKDLEKIASYPPWKHVIPLESFLQLSTVGNMIKNQLCPEIVGRRASFSRTSLREDCVHVQKAEIYFLIDGSDTITPDDFLEMKSFMHEIIKMFHVGPDRVRFGVVQYSIGVSSEFFLHQYSNVAGLQRAIGGIQQRGGSIRTGEALHNMARVFADTARRDVPHYLIVITDGGSSDLVADAAQALREKRVIIYAVGVRDANNAELKEIANDKVFFVNAFDSLKFIQKELVQDICSLETCKNRKADIIFLIDGSESISFTDFEKMKEFMRRMVNLSSISPDEIQIGLLQFSSHAQEEFRLNRYSSKVDIHAAVSAVKQLKDGTHTGKALNFTLPFFDSSRGGRPNIHQYLIVITDGVANDDVVIPAKALRDRNIIIFAIGVGEAKNAQLLEITNDQSKVYYEENFESLQNLEKEIFYKVCTPEGMDLSTPTRQVQQQLQRLLPEVMQHLALLYNISCVSGHIDTKFRYLVPDSNHQFIFDSGLEKYSDEIIQKFLANQFAKSNHMDSAFLMFLGESALRLSTAKVKVLLVFTDGLDDDLEKLKETSALLRSRGQGKVKEKAQVTAPGGFFWSLRTFHYPCESPIQQNPPSLLLERGVYSRPLIPQKQGHPGFDGLQGNVGNVGPQGNPGFPGPDGSIGKAGPRGMKGALGSNGYGLPGRKGIKPCEIVDFVRKNCRVSKCPAFPSEVVFALDMSNGVSQLDFERMKNIVRSLLLRMEISESNCPVGARVAVVSYNTKTNYQIRFSDYQGKRELLQAITEIPLELSSGSRNLGGTMKFVARHVFKRVRAGLLVRKVAVFFQADWVYDRDAVSTAILELSALNIFPTVITFTQDHNLPYVQLSNGNNGLHLFIWETEHQQDVEFVARCALCYDECQPAPECSPARPGPLEMDMDLVFLVDASHSVGTDVYLTGLSLVAAMLKDLQVAAEPRVSHQGARVALVTHTMPGFLPGSGRPPVREDFYLTTYGHRAQMQRRILETADRPLQGTPTLGHALEWTLEKVLLAAPLPRRIKVLFIIVASETSIWDREKLWTLSVEAKCKGIALFVLALGPGLGTHALAELALVASAPSEQHLLRLKGTSDAEMAYAQGFIRAFMNLLKSEQCPQPWGYPVWGPCSMDRLEGECHEYVLRWYFDKGQRACQQFWYGSCGGNANRFETKEDCEAQCVPVPF